MKFLLDCSPNRSERSEAAARLIAGQLITPISAKSLWGDVFGIDNGAFSRFDPESFCGLLSREERNKKRCLFVVSPDVVGSARRTLEMFDEWYPRLCMWPIALACQDGLEDFSIRWDLLSAVFIGGSSEWKESRAAADVVRASLIAGKHVHIGRVNTIRRFRKFDAMGAHTCDGSGASRFDWMLDRIAAGAIDDSQSLFEDNDHALREAERSTGDVCLSQQTGGGPDHD